MYSERAKIFFSLFNRNEIISIIIIIIIIFCGKISAWKVVCLSLRMDYCWTWSMPLTMWRLMIKTMDCVHKRHCHLCTSYRLDAARKTPKTLRNNVESTSNCELRLILIAFYVDVFFFCMCVCLIEKRK